MEQSGINTYRLIAPPLLGIRAILSKDQAEVSQDSVDTSNRSNLNLIPAPSSSGPSAPAKSNDLKALILGGATLTLCVGVAGLGAAHLPALWHAASGPISMLPYVVATTAMGGFIGAAAGSSVQDDPNITACSRILPTLAFGATGAAVCGTVAVALSHAARYLF